MLRVVRSRQLAWPIALALLPVLARCDGTSSPPAPPPDENLPGEQACDPTTITTFALSFDPPSVVVAPGQSRPVRLTVDPDVCTVKSVDFSSADGSVAAAPPSAKVDLRHATYDFNVIGGAAGKTTLTASLANYDGTTVTVDLPVDVRDAAAPACALGDTADATIDQGAPSMKGKGGLADAALATNANAFVRTDAWKLPPFDASISCGSDLVGPSGIDYVALSPAVTFTAKTALDTTRPLRRELDFTIPVNPAAFPGPARMRHLEVLFSSPAAKVPRPIVIASPRIEAVGSGYVLHFSSPWLGTYQAVVRKDAGSIVRTRHLTHRAVIGFSMGGGGAATFGFRHHDEFDAIAPMGGPSDWTWLLWFVENYALGGFCPKGQTCPQTAPGDYPMRDTFAHSEDFNHWWYETGSGNGGHFPRDEYVQIFTDLALMEQNPNGDNADAGLSFFARGPKASDPWVAGDTTGLPPGTNCAFTVEPIKNDPNNALQNQIKKQCAKSRCDPKNAWIVPSGYYDDEFNPDGSEQVISVCDGAQVGETDSPYSNTWAPPSADQAYPMDLALAVDLNKNGVRDENEPIIRSGHEPWSDVGVDGLADKNEPGYDAVTNPDPDQDDYDFQMNPSGTEGDHRYEQGEPYEDYGLDGVPNTKSSPYDVGEGDGKFTMAKGLENFYAVDPHSILRGWSTDIPGGPMTDQALANLAVWSDGGVRDLFNFAAVADNLEGAIASRRTADGHFVSSVAFYNGFQDLPGQDPTRPDDFAPAHMRWADLVASPSLRYGNVDATKTQIESGDGQHVGTGAQILYRLEAAFYFVAHQWPDADRLLTEPDVDNPETATKNELGIDCELKGRCEKIFTGPKTNRTGPIAITLPPGYGNEDNRLRDVRYPVVYVLHGYGQDPRDLEALAVISNNFMNDGTRSAPNRLAKFITVYVDGRCRVGADGQPECIQGSFYLDSKRQGGPQFDSWFDEVVKYIDQNYRTMAPSDVEEAP